MANIKTSAAEYAIARALFEDGHKLRVIEDRTGIPQPRLSKKAKAEGWMKCREDHLGIGAPPVAVVEDAGHVASDETRKMVNAMAGFGLDEDQIAVIVGISPNQLRATYAHELATAPPKMVARVAQSLFQMATDTNKPNVTAAMYLHSKWTETAGGKAQELGKKEVAQVKAKRAGAGKYAPAAPPKLVAAGGKIVK